MIDPDAVKTAYLCSILQLSDLVLCHDVQWSGGVLRNAHESLRFCAFIFRRFSFTWTNPSWL